MSIKMKPHKMSFFQLLSQIFTNDDIINSNVVDCGLTLKNIIYYIENVHTFGAG